jgi:predicted metal-dependent phosphoesterase TrpH
MMTARELVDFAERETDLDVIAVTDHDDVAPSLEAREYAAQRAYRVQVVPAVEVTTRVGHLLALFVEDRPTAFRPLLETADWVQQHGGLCVAPHPFTRWTHSLTSRTMHIALHHKMLAGVEVLNASPAGRASRARAVRFADQYALASLGGSDAHTLAVVGLARTCFRGRTPEDLRHAILSGSTYAEGRFASPREVANEALPQLARSMVHLPLRRLVRYARGEYAESRL